MSAASHTPSQVSQITGAHAVVAALLRHGITSGFGIPSIHNIALYEALRQAPEFHHWVVRHEQAAGFAADGFYRRSGQIAAIFASTGPGNLFTLVPLLESLQTNTPVLLIGTNIASSLLAASVRALHETPEQVAILRPLPRFPRRVASPDEITATFTQAAEILHGQLTGPVFIEIPHDFFHAPVSASFPEPGPPPKPARAVPTPATESATRQISNSRKPAILVGAGARDAAAAVRQLAELLQCPVFTTTT